MFEGALRNNGALPVMAGLIMVNIFWGASSIAAREALLQLSAIEIVTIRFAIALLFLFAIALLFKRGSLRISLKDVPVFMFLSIVGVSLQFILQVESLVYTTVTNFSLLFNLSTFFIMLLGACFLRERLTKRKLAGAAVAFAGVALIVSGGSLNFSSHLLGDLIGLASAALFGVYSIASKKLTDRYSLTTILLYTFLFGVMGLLPFYVLATPMTALPALTPLSWASILFLAVLCSVFAFFMYNHGLSRLKASDVAMSIYVTPLAGIGLAILLLGETMTMYTVSGAALILAGMYATQGEWRPDERPAKEARPAVDGE